MPDLPTGTVTFLFTDIEGSTRLLDEHRERYADLLADHRRVLRETFARYGGVEVDTQGDSFFVAFQRASDAVAAANDAQRQLELPVRMGIHTGEPQLTSEGYVGVDVHRAARICAAGHGGQVLVSQTTRDLVAADLRELGEHRLKDLSAPERLYQLGQSEFPPLRTLHQTNLPVEATPLVGRESEVGDIVARLRERRLVTLTGPGGVGKTRLALRAAAAASDSFPDGVFFVGLQAVREPQLVLPAVAKSLRADTEVTEWIGERETLLVLDNLEQVVECAPQLAALLAQTPRLRILCTSREPLRITGELEYQVEPLPADEGVELFRQRAIDSEPVEAVRAICARLDSLPLAIELAAARTRVLAPVALLERLDRALPLLAHGPRDASAGGRTLHATIQWSYDLLDDEERAVFDRLGVFAGGCRFEEAERVAGARLETIESLLEKALLRRREDRYSMLYLVREFALERLRDRGEVEACMSRFAELVLAVGREVVRDDLDNWRALVDWAVSSSDADTAMRITALGARTFRPEPAETIFWGHRVLEQRDREASALSQAHVLHAIGMSEMLRGAFQACVDAEERAVELFRQGDDAGLEDALPALGAALKNLDRMDEADHVLREALRIATSRGKEGDPFPALLTLGEFERDRGNLDAARELLERALVAAKQQGRWDHVPPGLSHGLGDLALEEGKPEEARRRYLEALAVAGAGGISAVVVHCVAGLAALAGAAGRVEQAADLWAAKERYTEIRGVEIGLLERRRYSRRLAAVSPELLDPARERWKDATAAAVEEAAAAAVD